jgi:iron(III) transport system substrate-binding protein
MKAMDANTKQYFSSESLMFQAIGRKEASISFAPLNSIIENKIKNELPIEVIDATNGSPIITDGIGMIKDCPHPNAAKEFIEFAGGVKVQAMFANEFNRIPTLAKAFETSPEWMSEITFKAMDVDWAKLSTTQSEWMQMWETDIRDVAKDIQQ